MGILSTVNFGIGNETIVMYIRYYQNIFWRDCGKQRKTLWGWSVTENVSVDLWLETHAVYTAMKRTW